MDEKERTSVPTSKTLRRRKMVVLLVGGGVLFSALLLIMATSHSSNEHFTPKKHDYVKDFTTAGDQVNPRDLWIAQGEKRLTEDEATEKQLEKTIARQQNEINQLSENKSTKHDNAGTGAPPAVAATSSTPTAKASFPPLPVPQPHRVADSAPGTASTTNALDASPVGPSGGQAKQTPGIFFVNVGAAPKTGASAGKGKFLNVKNYIPAGAFSQAVLLDGIDAPTGSTGQQNPEPILLRLTSLAFLPNQYRANTRECFVVGAGYGDLASERAYIRTERLSCVLRNGHVIDTKLDGWVAGEAGKTGVRGRLVSKQGQMLADAFLAGLGSGLGSSYSQSVSTVSTSALGSTQTVNPSKAFQHGLYSGVGTAFDQLAKFYIKMADQTFPVIEVPAGRTVTVILSKGVELKPKQAK